MGYQTIQFSVSQVEICYMYVISSQYIHTWRGAYNKNIF